MSQISAKIVADSISQGKRITTFELEYPRFIHSELMTHRVFSRNAMSSRAVPIEKMIEQVRTSPAMPIHWGRNQGGMQAKEEVSGLKKEQSAIHWKWAGSQAAECAEWMSEAGVHKQVVNRLLEPFQTMKTVLTSTEFENFYWLRNHEDAQPEIKKLAEEMLKAQEESKPIPLLPGEWHLPYYGEHGALFGSFSDEEVENAKAISASCCAQVSYRKLDDSLEKALNVYKRLVESEPVHASPFEHQATPISELVDDECDKPWIYWPNGVTHVDKEGRLWSGNFCGWIQHRQLIPNNVKKG